MEYQNQTMKDVNNILDIPNLESILDDELIFDSYCDGIFSYYIEKSCIDKYQIDFALDEDSEKLQVLTSKLRISDCLVDYDFSFFSFKKADQNNKIIKEWVFRPLFPKSEKNIE